MILEWVIKDAIKNGLPIGNRILCEEIKKDKRYINARGQKVKVR